MLGQNNSFTNNLVDLSNSAGKDVAVHYQWVTGTGVTTPMAGNTISNNSFYSSTPTANSHLWDSGPCDNPVMNNNNYSANVSPLSGVDSHSGTTNDPSIAAALK
jgi:hypothetical protein